jgi:hypothetical protein
MLKSCQCGKIQTEGKPDYCRECRTFTHSVYVRTVEVLKDEKGKE